MFRYSVAALLLAGIASSVSAELRPDDEPLTKCGVDFDVAYEILVPEPEAGQTEEQAIAKLAPDVAHLATALHAWSRQTSEKTVLASSHQGAEDSRKLAAIEKAEEDTWVNRLNGAKTEADRNSAFDDLMNRANDCAERFFPGS